MKRCYLAGPMTGIEKFNFPAFDAAAEDLRSRGIDVVSPAELDDPETRRASLLSADGQLVDGRHNGQTWGDFLARDVKLIADDGIDGVVVLPGWEASRGARLETFLARQCGLTLYRYPDMRPLTSEEIARAHEPASLPPDEGVCWHSHGSDDTGFCPGGTTAAEHYRSLLDEVCITDPTTGGQKGSKDAVLGDICPQALMEVARVCGFGRRKYARLNYLKGYDWSLSYDALQRHLNAFWGGEDSDPESGLAHTAHAAWHCLALLAFSLRNLGTDDRP